MFFYWYSKSMFYQSNLKAVFSLKNFNTYNLPNFSKTFQFSVMWEIIIEADEQEIWNCI